MAGARTAAGRFDPQGTDDGVLTRLLRPPGPAINRSGPSIAYVVSAAAARETDRRDFDRAAASGAEVGPGRCEHPMNPSQDTPSAGSGPPTATRRRFLGWLSRAFLGLWGLGAIGVFGAYLRPRARGERVAERIVRAGMLDDLRVGEARLVRHGTTPFFLVRADADHVVALSAVCTHVRCILDYDRSRKGLVCPCHEGRFDLSGNVLSGPPPRPLQRYEVSLRAGEIFVHL